MSIKMGQRGLEHKIKTYAKELGISDIGIAPVYPYHELIDVLEQNSTPFVPAPQKRIDPSLLLQKAQSAVMCVLNYYIDNHKGRIAKYARGLDYHQVMQEKLQELKAYIQSLCPDAKTFVFCDTSPLCDRYMAYLAGLGILGKNRMLIHPIFGSYVVIGGILTTLPLRADLPIEKSCLNCMRCVDNCPGGALRSNGRFDADLCVSYITQRKGVLSDVQQEALRNGDSIYGCDACADVCPHNSRPQKSELCGFTKDLIYSLSEEQLKDATVFSKVFEDRTFGWRGAEVLKRNLDILQQPKQSSPL